MRQHLAKFIKDKSVLILGFGREGRSTYRLLRDVGGYAKLAVSDMNCVDTLDDDVTGIFGETYLSVLDDYDLVFKSPGVVLPKPFDDYRCRITSQAEQFLTVYARQTVGITGTKGKSTTSSLLYHVLKNNGVDTVFAGNIGIPVFDIVDDLTASTAVVMEMSCHQLEYIAASPSVAVFLNLYEDHLDHYGSFEKYAHAKRNIYRFQRPVDVLFCHPDFLPEEGDCAAQICRITTDHLPNAPLETKLRGEHNRFNISVVYDIAKRYGVSDEGFLAAVASFSPLAHRLEWLGTVDGVDYYDDSISTTVESAVSAVNSIENAGTLLVGGMDRGIDYTGLVAFLPTCPLDTVIFMYESGKRVYEELTAKPAVCGQPQYVCVSDLKEAVDHAKTATAKGKACILSPAAASYGYFKNFEERGDVFRQLVFTK